ncbi:Abi-alpha family protein [Bradyrhizobium liaoningense]|uniref:Abi-alpha family protein n=1 Tax=Bradyrhizobium liaoningense TaxID=43992 RepID=UPI001BADF266|nr:Abi-alpha family protein [Bradyrhizobium liaoningense]MBR1169157.1 DUF4393 domain-containing protein [Bradyrhizobium liaoningense]
MSEGDSSDAIKSVVKAGAEVVTEVAKAEQEAQKTYQRALDLVGRAGTFLNGVFSPAAQELGHLFGEQMRFWRFRNGVRILEKAQAIVEGRGLKPEQIKALGFGEGLLMLEAASLEEDDAVQDMWARLMANAVDPETATKPEKVYVEILKALSSREVLFLELLWKLASRPPAKTTAEHNAYTKSVEALADAKWRRFSADERGIAIQNLVRLRCATFKAKPPDMNSLCAVLPTDGRNTFGPKWAAVDPAKLEKVINDLIQRQLAAAGVTDFPKSARIPVYPGTFPEADFVLTPLGRGLMGACAAERKQAPSGQGAPDDVL